MIITDLETLYITLNNRSYNDVLNYCHRENHNVRVIAKKKNCVQCQRIAAPCFLEGQLLEGAHTRHTSPNPADGLKSTNARIVASRVVIFDRNEVCARRNGL